MAKRALIVIDVQNEYFDGALPITDPPREQSLENIGRAMEAATAAGVPVIVVRHGTDDPSEGIFLEGLARLGAAPRDRAPPARLPDRQDAARLVHRHGARQRARGRGRRHGRDHGLHDAHVRRHDLAPGGAPRPGGRDPQRRDRHAPALQQRRQRRRRGAAPRDARGAGPVLRRRGEHRRLARPHRRAETSSRARGQRERPARPSPDERVPWNNR